MTLGQSRLPLNDPRWASYQGGYRTTYDASAPLIALLEEPQGEAPWQQLWDELHHQGDVGSASYAAVPWLIEILRRSPLADWNPLALICTIELARPNNPEITDELREGYFSALLSLPHALAEKPCHVWDDNFTQVAAAALALSRGQRAFAEIYLEFSLAEGKKWLAEYFDIEESQLEFQNF